jgi:hypothetical protein
VLAASRSSIIARVFVQAVFDENDRRVAHL